MSKCECDSCYKLNRPQWLSDKMFFSLEFQEGARGGMEGITLTQKLAECLLQRARGLCGVPVQPQRMGHIF